MFTFENSRPIFVMVAAIKNALFSMGMALVRSSGWGLGLSSNDGWYIAKPPKAGPSTCALSGHAEHKALYKQLVWQLAEPCGDGVHTGTIPRHQMALLRELAKGVWCGGAEAAHLALLEQVVVDEGLLIE
jgi:hypothetical protein